MSRPWLLLAALLTACNSYPSDPQCGQPGHHCCNWPSQHCHDGLTCNGNTCVGCGDAAGGLCCPGLQCSGNLTCDSTPGSAWACQPCGHIGQPACYNQRCVTGTYSGGNCVAASAGMCAGNMSFSFGTRSAHSHCGFATVTVQASSRDEGRNCAAQQVQATGGDRGDAEAIDETVLQDYELNGISDGRCSHYHVPAYSDADAVYCVQYNCMDCTVEHAESCP
jgi:hypothetical protein